MNAQYEQIVKERSDTYKFGSAKLVKMVRLLFISLLWGLTVAYAQEQGGFLFETNLEPTYTQAAEGNVTIFIKLVDESAEFNQAVLFLNIVELLEDGRTPQAAHLIFTKASESPKMFRRAYTRAELLKGVQTELTFKLRERAKPSTYGLVLQVFNGDNTNPNSVTAEQRLAIQSTEFLVEER